MSALLILILAAAAPAPPKAIALPGSAGAIGFDDLRYDPVTKRVLVPAGRTGNLDLIDPANDQVTAIGGFSVADARDSNYGQSVTSADAGDGFYFAVDRTAGEVVAIDQKSAKIVARAKLAAGPDYVRWVAPAHEVWVTEPRAEAIEVFSFANAKLEKKTSILVKGGPESLVIDTKRNRAHTHLWKKSTVVIDVAKHAVVATWPGGCEELRGIALDAEKGWLFIGCEEGAATVLDVAHEGRVLSTAKTAKGVDIIAYDAGKKRLYAPGEEDGDLSILSVSDKGELSVRATVHAAKGAHCAAVDDRGHVYVCDPDQGRILMIVDP